MTFSQNYFELFDLPENFDIDLKKLSEHYLIIQRNTHPDRFINASKQEQMLSASYAADVNNAYQILQAPTKRAAYMLGLNDIQVNDDSSCAVDPEFLMQQIELRENLDEIRALSDPEAAIEEINSQLELLIAALSQEFIVCLQNLNGISKQQAIEVMHKMQFIAKIQHESSLLEDELLG